MEPVQGVRKRGVKDPARQSLDILLTQALGLQALEPTNKYIYLILGQTQEKLGQYDDAIKRFDHGLSILDPDDPDYWPMAV